MKLSTLCGAALATAILGTTVSLALAGGHSPVEQREAVMKTMGQNAGVIGGMLRGQADFDAAKANASLAAMREAFGTFSGLFPEGTEGAGTNEFAAGPAIWSDPAGFTAENEKMIAALDAAIAANPQDTAALGAAFGGIGQVCSSCHEGYRIKK